MRRSHRRELDAQVMHVWANATSQSARSTALDRSKRPCIVVPPPRSRCAYHGNDDIQEASRSPVVHVNRGLSTFCLGSAG